MTYQEFLQQPWITNPTGENLDRLAESIGLHRCDFNPGYETDKSLRERIITTLANTFTLENPEPIRYTRYDLAKGVAHEPS